MQEKKNILHKNIFSYIYIAMNNFDTPLYPPDAFPSAEKNEEKSQPQNLILSLLSSLGGDNISNILPLLLGMKNGNVANISSLLSNKENPLSTILSSLSTNTKKESQSSLKDIPDEEF